jgi:arginyl-tRNA--protein-N-Asp/Glu arginylyltransferase
MQNPEKPAYLGGKQKKAEYESTHVRVPNPIKEEVLNIIWNWRKNISSKSSNNEYCQQLENLDNLIKELQINLDSPRSSSLVKIRKHLEEKCQTSFII